MKAKKYLLVILVVAVCAASFGAYYYLRSSGVKEVAGTPSTGTSGGVHVYKNPEKRIAKIKIDAFYTIPKNKVSQLESNWKEQLVRVLTDSAQFHALQFRGLSEITYEIFPEPVILESDDVFYDTEVTAGGNPRALINVAKELGRRVFSEGGDLYTSAFADKDPSEYRVLGIIYEGVGASGGIIYDSSLETAEEIARDLGVPESMVYILEIQKIEAFFLVNRREYLTKERAELYGSSIFYHEFGHTIGLPDEFDGERAFSNDIMGVGESKPISHVYISRDFLRGMGVE